jgi:hypothetical protein
MTIRRRVIARWLFRLTDPAVLFNIHHGTRIEPAASAMPRGAPDREEHAA